MSERKPPRILAIAGSDSSGGAGIQADIKTIAMLGGYAMTAITAVTAQNTLGVQAIAPMGGGIVAKQIASCIEDIGVDAIKIGMLHDVEIIDAVASELERLEGKVSVVLDPVMIATSGDALIAPDAVSMLRDRLFPLASLITPNLPELEHLAERSLRTNDEMADAALELAGHLRSLPGGDADHYAVVVDEVIRRHLEVRRRRHALVHAARQVEARVVARAVEAALPFRIERLGNHFRAERRRAAQMRAGAHEHEQLGLDRTVFVAGVLGLLVGIVRLGITQAALLTGERCQHYRGAADDPHRLTTPLHHQAAARLQLADVLGHRRTGYLGTSTGPQGLEKRNRSHCCTRATYHDRGGGEEAAAA